MLTKETLNKHMVKQYVGLNFKYFALILIIFISLVLFYYISSNHYRDYLIQEKREEVMQDLMQKGNLLTKTIDKRFAFLHALEGYTQDQITDGLDFSTYPTFASGIFNSADGIYNLNIAPRGVIQYIYPSQNQSMIGDSIINNENPLVRIDVQRSMMTQEPIVSGPFEIRQGGQELVIRKALFEKGEFWGLVSVSLMMDSIYNSAGITNKNGNMQYAIRNSFYTFYGSKDVFDLDPIIYKVELEYNTFEIGAIPKGGWEKSIQNELTIYKIISFLMVSMILMIINMLIYQSAKINRKVEEKTSEVNFTNIKLEKELLRREELEKSLSESERSKSALLANLPGMAYRCRFNRDWTMEFVSEGCFELTGYHSDDIVVNKRVSFNDIIKSEDREYLWQKWNAVLAKRQVFTEEYGIVTATGENKWVWEQGQGVYGEDGSVIAIEGFITDISERKRREEEIIYLSYHDMLTSLWNRRYFEEMKEQLDTVESLPLSVLIADINGLKLINDTFGHAEGDKLLKDTAKILSKACREKDVLARTGGDEFCILFPQTSYQEVESIKKSIVDALEFHKLNKENDSFFTGIALGFGTKVVLKESLDSVIKEAEDFMYRRKLLQNKSLHSSLINSIKTTLFEKSIETEQHAERLTVLSKQLGEKIGLNDEQLTELELLSALHDIGKIVISDDILNKPSSLTKEERMEMMKHSEIGYRIAKASQELLPISEYILTHHERWDGKGYPQGLFEEEIPLLSRILAVVDAYDAMTQDRPYRKAMLIEDALAEIKRNAGSQFDPNVAQVFTEIFTNYKI